MIPPALVELGYLAAAVLFIVGLKWLNSPATARQGNRVSGLGMLLAIVVALLERRLASYAVIAAGLLVGTALGLWMARAVKMTAMPQMVALLNGFGGAASLIVGGAELLRAHLAGRSLPVETGVAVQLSVLVGAVTFTGSLVAFAKLQELVAGRAVTFPFHQPANALVFLAVMVLSAYAVAAPHPPLAPFYASAALSLALGVLLVIPIGGADMPVVISLLNSYSGIAAAMTGFVIDNHVLIISGALVGSSGIILSTVMTKAMNRSLANVLFGAFGGAAAAGARAEGMTVRTITTEDAALQLAYARSVMIVPGYGMAVAQAQHQVRELAELIERRGGDVRYAIHPVAGRMPGHMNVLLSEAQVPYDRLVNEVEDANAQMERADVALVIGANDIVNPAAVDDPASPLYGMPVLQPWRAARVIVLKRGMAAGFAGVENPLFGRDNAVMLFGDARASLGALAREIKAV